MSIVSLLNRVVQTAVKKQSTQNPAVSKNGLVIISGQRGCF